VEVNPLTKEEFLQATAAAPVVLANFKRDGQTHPLLTRALQRLSAANTNVKVIELDLDALADLVNEYLEAMDPFSGTLDFSYPGVALYRDGRLITTFQPWMNLDSERLNERLVEEQLAVFLRKLAPTYFGQETAEA